MTHHIGDQIAAAIKESGRTQAQVARDFGVSQPAVAQWITTGRIAKKHIAKLSVYFRKPLSYWLPNDEATAVMAEEERSSYDARDAPDSLESTKRSREIARIARLTQFATAAELSKMAGAMEQVLIEDRRSRENAESQPEKTA